MWSVGTLKFTKPCEMPQYFWKIQGFFKFCSEFTSSVWNTLNTKLYFHLLWSWTLSLNDDEESRKKDTLEIFSVLQQKSYMKSSCIWKILQSISYFSIAYHFVMCLVLSGLEEGGYQSESLVRQGHKPSWDWFRFDWKFWSAFHKLAFRKLVSTRLHLSL